jgi:uncharacterized protein YgiM (DUF1202 family)
VHRLVSHLLSLKRQLIVVILVACFVFSAACKKASNLNKEVAYVNTPQMVLRDRLAPIFEKKGTVKLGDRVYVLDHSKRFSLVRTESGEEGWIADRYLVDATTYGQFEKLVTDSASAPVQAHGTTRSSLNLHVSPGRDTEHLFQLKEGDKVEIIKRATAEKPGSVQPRPPAKKASATNKAEPEPPPPPALEDWTLVRSSEKRTGWVLSRMIDVDVPIEIAQYAEGQRIVSSFVVSEVQDADKKVPQYLVMLTDSKDGLPWDFNQIRVFTWNTKRHRYETAYREHNLVGVFPVKVGREDFGKEGVLPVFTLRVKDMPGKESDRKYRMIGPIVRRVATPEELKQEATERAAQRAANPKKSSLRKHRK